MSTSKSGSQARTNNELPPTRHLPLIYQTLSCRWFPEAFIRQCHTRLGDSFTVRVYGMPPLVFLARPSDIHAVLCGDPSCLHPGAGGAAVAPVVGERSFMLLDEDEHTRARKSIAPAFHRRVAVNHTDLLVDAVKREVATWPLNTAFPLDPQVRALTLRLILHSLFGDRENGDILPALHDRLIKMLAVTASIVLQEPKMRHIPGWRKTWKTFVKQRAEVDALLLRLVRRQRSRIGEVPMNLLDILLSADGLCGLPMSNSELRDNLMSMILAGHETTAGEVLWAFQLLAHNPRVQQRLAAEIDKGTEERYLTAVINETMRHRPVFLFAIPREVVKSIKIGSRIYHPPVRLVACTYLLHHDPKLYPRPHEFRPERFIDEPPEPRTWLPWGGGHKFCLGRRFALLEVKVILREVLLARAVLPASRHIERSQWRSAILVPRAGGRVVMCARRGKTSSDSREGSV